MTYKEAAYILCDTMLDNPCGCDGCPLSGEEVDKEGNMICKLRKCEDEAWIPVEKGLPDQYEDVLISVKNGKVNRSWIDYSGKFVRKTSKCGTHYMDGSVLAWMPLPEAYKGDTK